MLVLRLSVRRSGFVDTVAGLGRSDHICWVFHTPSQFRSSAVQFLSDGLASGQRGLLIAEAARDTELDDVDGFAEARAAGAVQVQDLAIYGSGQAVDPATQVRAYADATEQALADGYTGLRVAADATTLVRTPESRAAFARYEFLMDRFMTANPFAAMCSYHVGELGHNAAAELASVHPLAQPSATSLRLFASEEPGVAGVLAGEVDLSTQTHFRRTLDRAELIDVDGEITIDARELAFIDHRALMHLVDHVRLRGATAVLHVGEHSVVRPLAALLRLPDLRVEVR